MCEDILNNALIPCACTCISEVFIKRLAARVTLSVCFLFFAAKQNVHWNVQDWHKDGEKVSSTIQVILLSTAMT